MHFFSPSNLQWMKHVLLKLWPFSTIMLNSKQLIYCHYRIVDDHTWNTYGQQEGQGEPSLGVALVFLSLNENLFLPID
jgi:hypothetical protein